MPLFLSKHLCSSGLNRPPLLIQVLRSDSLNRADCQCHRTWLRMAPVLNEAGYSPQGCQMAITWFLYWMYLAFGLEGLRLRYATLQNLIPSFPWIVPLRPPPRCNPRKGRDQILPSGNLDSPDLRAAAASKSVECIHRVRREVPFADHCVPAFKAMPINSHARSECGGRT